MPVHRRLLNTDPSYSVNRAQIESLAATHRRAGGIRREGITLIPVIVHVVYHTDEQNVSAEQVASQIAALTRDFRKQNADSESIPDVWRDVADDADIQFVLTDKDPDGNPSSGIERRRTDAVAFIDDDAVKFSSRGGLNAWPSDRYLNLWVCPLLGLLGYAQFPGGPPETDGVVINFSAFGTVGTASEPFHLGRTATHEVGHWLNLFHIWGDDGLGCSGSDFVDDTPNQGGPNSGRPQFPSPSCGNEPDGDMFMNYMDYTDDAVMVMFTAGQVDRIHAALAGPRASFQVEPEEPVEPEPVEPEEPEEPAEPGETGHWIHTDVTLDAGAPDAAGDPAVAVGADGTVRVLYRGLDEHVHELRRIGGGLTPSEIEVLQLLGDGRTNVQIAGDLSISVAAVERHLANIYRKIGASSRVEAVTYALRRYFEPAR